MARVIKKKVEKEMRDNSPDIDASDPWGKKKDPEGYRARVARLTENSKSRTAPPGVTRGKVFRDSSGRMSRVSARTASPFKFSTAQLRLLRRDFRITDLLNRKKGVVNTLTSFEGDVRKIIKISKGTSLRKKAAILRRGKLAGGRLGIVLAGGAALTAGFKALPKPARLSFNNQVEPPFENAGKKLDKVLGFRRAPGRPKKLVSARKRRQFVRKVFGLNKKRGLSSSSDRAEAARRGWEVRRQRYGQDGRR